MKQDSPTPVQLSGKPGRLVTVLRLPPADTSAFTKTDSCLVDLPGVNVRRVSVRKLRSAEGELSVLKIKLPVSTPPGIYKGTVQIAGNEFPLEVDVAQRGRLSLFPRSLSTTATPGAVIKLNLTILNKGNVAVRLDKEYRFCVFERGGIDRALFLALAGDQVDGDKRLDKLLDELADSHGGRLRVEIESGNDPIPPGEAREMSTAIRLSDRLRPGRIYSGAWKFENASFPVEIDVKEVTKETAR